MTHGGIETMLILLAVYGFIHGLYELFKGK